MGGFPHHLAGGPLDHRTAAVALDDLGVHFQGVAAGAEDFPELDGDHAVSSAVAERGDLGVDGHVRIGCREFEEIRRIVEHLQPDQVGSFGGLQVAEFLELGASGIADGELGIAAENVGGRVEIFFPFRHGDESGADRLVALDDEHRAGHPAADPAIALKKPAFHGSRRRLAGCHQCGAFLLQCGDLGIDLLDGRLVVRLRMDGAWK